LNDDSFFSSAPQLERGPLGRSHPRRHPTETIRSESPLIIVVTGASGVGKTTLVHALEAQNIPGVRCYYFDSVGVPEPGAMRAEFGSPEAWQAATTRRWIAHLAANPDHTKVAVLDGQIRPSEVTAALAQHGVTRGKILLVDCSHEVREARLRGERGQPELALPRMAAWAAYLRGQADALNLPILDTTHLSVAEAAEELVKRIRTWLWLE
jgi:adenylylsulfate kinase-like enzyme